jgi:FtsH-binding integral membrane protein
MAVEKMRRYVYAILVLGLAVCLTGAALMVFGEGLLGETHTGIAAVIGIVGIGIVGTFAATFAATSSKRSPKETKSSTGGV